MKKTCFYIFSIFLSLTSTQLYAQGYIMLSGGGAESAGGWSDIPYRWVVEHAQNKKVAVIGYDSAPTDWIPSYFKGFGAKWSRNFIVASRTSADLQSLYDSLITYNAVFIRGGDQSKYYEYYKGTKVQSALQLIYDNGGVLSGTSAGTAILSPIIYTAQVASIDPATALLDAYSTQITLEKDFLNTLPKKYIYDTHFNERGRFGRLPSFMASWYKKTSENVIGIGVGDHTALCISPDGNAKVYGTGSVNFIYNTNTAQLYDINVSMMRAKNMKIAQLLHGNTIDLNSGVISGLTDFIQPNVSEENARQTIFITGTDYPSDDAYNQFVNQVGVAGDATIIVTGSDLSRANDVKTSLQGKGATNVNIIQAIASNQNDLNTQTLINSAKKVFVISNDYTVFINFLKGAGNGILLKAKLKEQGMISFFAGDNARYAGKTVINKYTGFGYSSYHGEMEFLPGLGLFKTTAIMPYAFISADTYENTVSGLPYAMNVDSLRYGLYITGNTFVQYSFTSDNKSFFKNLSGSYPLIYLENKGTHTGLANQGPYTASRNIAGFESMNLRFLGISDTVTVGKNVPMSISNESKLGFKVFPNPARDVIHVQGESGQYSIDVFDLIGRVVAQKNFVDNIVINLSHCSKGVYLIKINDLKTQNTFSSKLCLVK